VLNSNAADIAGVSNKSTDLEFDLTRDHWKAYQNYFEYLGKQLFFKSVDSPNWSLKDRSTRGSRSLLSCGALFFIARLSEELRRAIYCGHHAKGP
jgi:hypothetical protein